MSENLPVRGDIRVSVSMADWIKLHHDVGYLEGMAEGMYSLLGSTDKESVTAAKRAYVEWAKVPLVIPSTEKI